MAADADAEEEEGASIHCQGFRAFRVYDPRSFQESMSGCVWGLPPCGLICSCVPVRFRPGA